MISGHPPFSLRRPAVLKDRGGFERPSMVNVICFPLRARFFPNNTAWRTWAISRRLQLPLSPSKQVAHAGYHRLLLLKMTFISSPAACSVTVHLRLITLCVKSIWPVSSPNTYAIYTSVLTAPIFSFLPRDTAEGNKQLLQRGRGVARPVP